MSDENGLGDMKKKVMAMLKMKTSRSEGSATEGEDQKDVKKRYIDPIETTIPVSELPNSNLTQQEILDKPQIISLIEEEEVVYNTNSQAINTQINEPNISVSVSKSPEETLNQAEVQNEKREEQSQGFLPINDVVESQNTYQNNNLLNSNKSTTEQVNNASESLSVEQVVRLANVQSEKEEENARTSPANIEQGRDKVNPIVEDVQNVAQSSVATESPKENMVGDSSNKVQETVVEQSHQQDVPALAVNTQEVQSTQQDKQTIVTAAEEKSQPASKKISFSTAKKEIEDFAIEIERIEKDIKEKYGINVSDFYYEDELPDDLKIKLVEDYFNSKEIVELSQKLLK